MSSKKRKQITQAPQKPMLFGRKNYLFMLIGLGFIAIGFILMSGGGSKDPNVWNEAIFNFRRIRVAPMLILLGLGIEIYAIMRKPN
jgi:hypothetical protein